MRIVLLSGDLMIYSAVSGAANLAGLPLVSGTQPEQIQDALSDPEALVLLDLGQPGADPGRCAELMTTESLCRAIAFGPHVHVDRMNAARSAGFGQVLARGQFMATLPRLLPSP